MCTSRIEVQGPERLTSNVVIDKIMRLFCFDGRCSNVGDESSAGDIISRAVPRSSSRPARE